MWVISVEVEVDVEEVVDGRKERRTSDDNDEEARGGACFLQCE
jgi:hypothetical protein